MFLKLAKFFIGLFILSLSLSPISVFAEGCKCTITLKGTGCDLNQTAVFGFSQEFSVSTLLDQVPWLSCPAKSIASNFVDGKQTVPVSKTSCEKIQKTSLSGTQQGYTYNVSCTVSTEAPTLTGKAFTTPSGTATTTPSATAATTSSSNKGSGKSSDVVSLVNPIGSTKGNPQGELNITLLVGKAIKAALGIVGAVAFAVFVIGGFMWLTSAGNSDQVKKGTETMLWATIGICIIFASYAILGFIITSTGAGNAGPSSPLKGSVPSSEKNASTSTTPKGTPKGTTKKPTAVSLCEKSFAASGFGCWKDAECDKKNTTLTDKTTKLQIDLKLGSLNAEALATKQIKNKAEIKTYYISGLCGTGSTICCIKKPTVVTVPGKCINKVSLLGTCSARIDATKSNYLNSVACKNNDPKVCTWTADNLCEPTVKDCAYKTKESECTDTINKQYCDWVKI